MIKCYLYPQEFRGEHYTTNSKECLLIDLFILPPLGTKIHLTDEQIDEWNELYKDSEDSFEYDGLLIVQDIFLTVMDDNPTVNSILLSCKI